MAVKIRVKKNVVMGDDNDDPTPKKLTPQEQAIQDAQAKDFAARHGLMNPQDAHVGEYGAPYVDATGKVLPPGQAQRYPFGTVTDIRMIPSDIAGNILKFNDGRNLWYYEDPHTGDPVYVSHEIAASSRFNPNRGTYNASIPYAKK